MLYRRRSRSFGRRNEFPGQPGIRIILVFALILAGLFLAFYDQERLVFAAARASSQRFENRDLALPGFLQRVERTDLSRSISHLHRMASISGAAWGGRSPDLDFKRLAFDADRVRESIVTGTAHEGRQSLSGPVKINSRFGYRRWGNGFRHHDGIDIALPHGSPIRAHQAGTVSFSGWRQGYGFTVMIDHGGGKETLYAHASALLARPGQKVEKGDVIARVGNTGRSFGAHLHFEIRHDGVPVDPEEEYLAAQRNAEG